jgi:urease accessory protein
LQTLTDLSLLRLLHLADSAIPIGTLSHSFGFEALLESRVFTLDSLPGLMRTYLEESMLLDAVFCRSGYRLAFDECSLRELDTLLSARKPARETREASLVLGRRFCRLVSACMKQDLATVNREIHFAIAFGVACRKLDIPEESCILAFLEQGCASVLSGLVRLMPLGQESASLILWDLKGAIAETCNRSRDLDPRQAPCFQPALEIASMRHPRMETRLFVS